MTTQDLYEALTSKPDLHSVPELYNDMVIWHLYKDAYIEASCYGKDTYINIASASLLRGSFMHWHPDEKDMVDELYTLGKKGNLLVLKKSLLGTSTFYAGPPENCPLTDRTPLHLGKKKWDGGRFIYLEQK